MKELIIKVDGMHCSGCEKRIKNSVEEISGVENVEANAKDGSVKIVLNGDVKLKDIEDVIEDIGFEIIKED